MAASEALRGLRPDAASGQGGSGVRPPLLLKEVIDRRHNPQRVVALLVHQVAEEAVLRPPAEAAASRGRNRGCLRRTRNHRLDRPVL